MVAFRVDVAAGRDADPRISNSDGASVGTSQSLSVYANSHGFIGRDRGYRALGFEHARIPLHDESTLSLGSQPREAGGTAGDGWALVVDDERRLLGWVRPADLAQEEPVDTSALALGGTLARVDGPLRAALDAALSSPSRRGVVVDGDGRLVGTCRATEVLAVIESQERPRDPAATRSA